MLMQCCYVTGNPWYGDLKYQCFNNAKNWQVDWYANNKVMYSLAQLTSDTGFSETLSLVGVGEYNIAGSNPVVVKLQAVSGLDFFVGFNRATGPNIDMDEGRDQVTVILTDKGNGTGGGGDSYSQTYLKAVLGVGQSYSIENFGNTGRIVTITVNSIDLTSTPGVASVTISSPAGPPPPSPPPTPAPTPLPTNAPTFAPVAPCTSGEKHLKVTILTDNYPSETTWIVKDTCTGTNVMSGGTYSSTGTTYVSQQCLPEEGGSYEFTINDSYGDGICCGYGSGSYTVEYGGVSLASGGQFTSTETKSLYGSCNTTPPPSPSPTNPPTPVPSNARK